MDKPDVMFKKSDAILLATSGLDAIVNLVWQHVGHWNYAPYGRAMLVWFAFAVLLLALQGITRRFSWWVVLTRNTDEENRHSG